METVAEAKRVLDEMGAKWTEFICPICGDVVHSPNGNKNERVLCPNDMHGIQKIQMTFKRFVKSEELD